MKSLGHLPWFEALGPWEGELPGSLSPDTLGRAQSHGFLQWCLSAQTGQTVRSQWPRTAQSPCRNLPRGELPLWALSLGLPSSSFHFLSLACALPEVLATLRNPPPLTTKYFDDSLYKLNTLICALKTDFVQYKDKW